MLDSVNKLAQPQVRKRYNLSHRNVSAVHEAASYQARRCNRAALSSTGIGQDLLLDEAREATRLGAGLPPGREYGPEIDRRQRPLVQHRPDRAGFQLGCEHPFGSDREAEGREHALSDALRRAHAHATIDNHGRFRTAPSERP
jgi:hypothetical protein